MKKSWIHRSGCHFVVIAIMQVIPFCIHRVSGQTSSRMPDGKEWMISNLNIEVPDSYCYENIDSNCVKYGRLYTWKAAVDGCNRLGKGWRLPSNNEWETLANQYGGVHSADSARSGSRAYDALLQGGTSGFNVILGGNRNPDGTYARREAHGFYWTSTETDHDHAWLYNFGTGAKFLNRHHDSEKKRAASVRCVKD